MGTPLDPDGIRPFLRQIVLEQGYQRAITSPICGKPVCKIRMTTSSSVSLVKSSNLMAMHSMVELFVCI
jgi:hypothetical protein